MYYYLSSFLCISFFNSFYTSRSLFMSFPVNIKILQQAFIHSINLQKAGVGQPKYCNNAYAYVVLTNLCSIFGNFKLNGMTSHKHGLAAKYSCKMATSKVEFLAFLNNSRVIEVLCM